jgi:hypothetical protein
VCTDRHDKYLKIAKISEFGQIAGPLRPSKINKSNSKLLLSKKPVRTLKNNPLKSLPFPKKWKSPKHPDNWGPQLPPPTFSKM